MRLRITELMRGHRPPLRTAYQLAKASDGAISMTTAHRLVSTAGRPARIELDTLQALCETFEVEPGALFEMDAAEPPAEPEPAPKGAKRKAR